MHSDAPRSIILVNAFGLGDNADCSRLCRAVQGFQGAIDRNPSAPESAIGITSPL